MDSIANESTNELITTDKIITNDGVEMIIFKSIANHFITLKNVIQDITSDYSAIKLPISSLEFNRLLTYLNKCIALNDTMLNNEFTGFCKSKKEQTEEEKTKINRWVIHKKYLSNWETEFYNDINDDALEKLFNSADYLDCPLLTESFNVEKEWRKIRGKGKVFIY